MIRSLWLKLLLSCRMSSSKAIVCVLICLLVAGAIPKLGLVLAINMMIVDL